MINMKIKSFTIEFLTTWDMEIFIWKIKTENKIVLDEEEYKYAEGVI